MSRKLFEIYNTIDRLIQRKSTGTPEQLARKLSISKRTLFEYISVMKEMNAPVKYDRQRQTYFYEGGGISK